MKKKFKDFITESMLILSTDKLRDSLQEIMSNIEGIDSIDINTACGKLKDIYNINITPDILHDILDKWDKKDYTVFSKQDKSWMDYFSYQKQIKKPFKKNKVVFGKGRNKDVVTYNYNKQGKNKNTGHGGYLY
jgi:hypothetical protein